MSLYSGSHLFASDGFQEVRRGDPLRTLMWVDIRGEVSSDQGCSSSDV
jgi:hypothetical protein